MSVSERIFEPNTAVATSSQGYLGPIRKGKPLPEQKNTLSLLCQRPRYLKGMSTKVQGNARKGARTIDPMQSRLRTQRGPRFDAAATKERFSKTEEDSIAAECISRSQRNQPPEPAEVHLIARTVLASRPGLIKASPKRDGQIVARESTIGMCLRS
jgi:hypothetical protein